MNNTEFSHKLYVYVITWLFVILAYIVYKVLNGADIKSVEVILIALFGMVNLMLGYMWGASSGGARKDAAIQSLAASQAPQSTEIKVDNVENINAPVDKIDNTTTNNSNNEKG